MVTWCTELLRIDVPYRILARQIEGFVRDGGWKIFGVAIALFNSRSDFPRPLLGRGTLELDCQSTANAPARIIS